MTEMTAAPAQAAPVDFGQALSALLRRYLDGAQQVVADIPGGPRGFQILSVSAAGACSNQARIAQSLGIDRTVMTYLVDDLEAAGLVERRPDPADRRARRIVPTDGGTLALADAAGRLRDVENTVLASLSEAEAEAFRSLLAQAVVDAPIDHSACDGPAVPTC
ncbi:MAG: MarR family winged helix-turn-helix transcriptional regulator [Aeromicrobium sp.]